MVSTRPRTDRCLAGAMAPAGYSPGEENANRLTHGLGVGLSVVGLVLMVMGRTGRQVGSRAHYW